MVAICKRNSCSVLGAWRSYVIIMNLLETLSEVTHMCYQPCEAARKLACSSSVVTEALWEMCFIRAAGLSEL